MLTSQWKAHSVIAEWSQSNDKGRMAWFKVRGKDIAPLYSWGQDHGCYRQT
jgi:hypothetical protein